MRTKTILGGSRAEQRNRQKGQSILLVVVAAGLVLAGAMGLAIDSSQLYAHRQMAQAAADAAAQAGILSIYAGTNTGTNAFGGSSISPCASGSALTPCAYGSKNGFGLTNDRVDVDFPTSVSGVTLSPDFTPAAIHVVVSRPVKATFLGMFGATSTTIKAAATAAITQTLGPIPIVVLHPSLDGALSGNGNPTITICGGPQQSIQVNSKSATAIIFKGTPIVNLSQASPCSPVGTGSDFGVFGGPAGPNPADSTVLPSFMIGGTTSHYLQPNTPVPDPLKAVAAPAQPATAGTKVTGIAVGTGDCPASSTKTCTIFYPGDWSGGIHIKNETAIFNPGVYYIDSNGFVMDSGSAAVMCSTTCVTTGALADTTSGCCTTNKGMMVYMNTNGGIVDVGSNAGAKPPNTNLVGSDKTGPFKNILFFVAHDAPAQAHALGGGGALSIIGTFYGTNPTSHNQALSLQGTPGSATQITGEIVTDTLTLGGNAGITMNLDPSLVVTVNRVSLVK